MTKEVKRAYGELHIAVIFFGFTAILGELISLQEFSLVWWRMLLTSLSLLLFPGILQKIRRIGRKDVFRLVGIGIIVSLHWVTFFGSVKYANVSVALSCFGTTAFFTSVFEPLLVRRPFRKSELMLGLLIIPGIYLIFHFAEFYATGIILGLISAMLAAIFNSLNKGMIHKADPLGITLIELGSGWVFLSLMMPLIWLYDPGFQFQPAAYDWLWLCLLAFLCTTLAYVLALRSLRQLSAFTANLTINLEPIYGIILASIFFKDQENLNTGFYLGAAIILLSLVLHAFIQYMPKAKRAG